ncbi:hypothetical protein GCM10010841_29970 [Deinococcus aerophilus]|uniref:Excalibur calcium-binding domain-containing protein n=1 Tax=Deinococcus aerophilus TaxID=522488 RepID=A0ABQ2H025_9DEIO|nr:hypothetical protein GCM10010841_29970 [Deinococcus aerophilus]
MLSWALLGHAGAAGFGIETRLLGRPLTAAQQATVRDAAARVSALITSPFVPVRVDIAANDCDRGLPRVQGTLKKLLVFVVVKRLKDDVYATGMPCDLRDGSYLPVYGVIDLNSDGLSDLPREDLLDTMIHELLHVLGVGTLWEADYRVSVSGDTDGRTLVRRVGGALYYTGPRALAAYRTLGGQGPGVPLDPDAGHWSGRAVCAEILSGDAGDFTGRVNPVSVLTLGALEDLGYRVNRAGAGRFSLPKGSSCAAQLKGEASGDRARTPPVVPPGGFASCAAARAAGATLPIRRGQPGYRTQLDGDRDGLACESG